MESVPRAPMTSAPRFCTRGTNSRFTQPASSTSERAPAAVTPAAVVHEYVPAPVKGTCVEEWLP